MDGLSYGLISEQQASTGTARRPCPTGCDEVLLGSFVFCIFVCLKGDMAMVTGSSSWFRGDARLVREGTRCLIVMNCRDIIAYFAEKVKYLFASRSSAITFVCCAMCRGSIPNYARLPSYKVGFFIIREGLGIYDALSGLAGKIGARFPGRRPGLSYLSPSGSSISNTRTL